MSLLDKTIAVLVLLRMGFFNFDHITYNNCNSFIAGRNRDQYPRVEPRTLLCQPLPLRTIALQWRKRVNSSSNEFRESIYRSQQYHSLRRPPLHRIFIGLSWQTESGSKSCEENPARFKVWELLRNIFGFIKLVLGWKPYYVVILRARLHLERKSFQPCLCRSLLK